MWAEQMKLTCRLTLLFLSGALCSVWNVEYKQPHICAVKGSSVVIPCSFHYPDKEVVQSVKWGHERYNIFDGPFIYDSNLTNNSLRFQYIGDRKCNCSLEIKQAEHNDTGTYTFRFITGSKTGKWTGQNGSRLKVVDLNITVTKLNGNTTMTEGNTVNLTCTNACDDGNQTSAFTWLMNGEPINEGPVLYLSSLSSANSGNYTCSLKTHTGTTSGVINIDVEYGPKNTSVSITPSVEVDAGDNITLICSSHANPPVENYTWFKINSDDIVDVGHQPVTVSHDGGQYFCSAANKHGSQNSSVITLKMTVEEAHPAAFNRYELLIIPAVAVLLIVTSVIVIRRLNKKRTRTVETDCEEDIQNNQNTDTYTNWPVFDNNQSQADDLCEGVEIIYTTVNFHNKRISNMQQQMDPNNDDECVIYSTVCRTQQLDPSYTELS